VKATLSADGPVKLLGGSSQSVSINPKGARGEPQFSIVANSTIGWGHIKVSVIGLGAKFEDATEISVRPAAGLPKLSGSGSIAGGSTKSLVIGLGDFIPDQRGLYLVVSRSPVLELGEQLRYLVQYPSGCTEQTVSAAFSAAVLWRPWQNAAAID